MRRRFMQLKNNNLPLYFEALEDGLLVSFSNDLEYCIDDSKEWIKLSASELTPQINTGQIIKFRSNISPDNLKGCGTFIVTKRFKAGGNPISLVLYNKIDANCFLHLFNNCENLVDASQIILSTKLAYRCYYSMFSGCTNLIAAPELPATVLTSHCYTGMFEGCTSLVNAPELPATALTTNCYVAMFRNCTNLNYIKMLATDISATYCLYDWVRGVSSTGTFVKSKDATWNTTPGALGSDGVPAGWTVVNDGEESGGGNDFGIEFPLYLEFDYCNIFGLTTSCVRAADELGIKLYNCLTAISNEYDEDIGGNGSYLVVSGQILDMLGIEIYIENVKVVEVHREGDLHFMVTNGMYDYTCVHLNGSITCDYE